MAERQETEIPPEGAEHPERPESAGVLRQLRGDVVSLTKARLSLLVVLTSCFGYFLATKGVDTFSWSTFFHMFFGTSLAAAGAAVFNQLMEVEFDRRMVRTSDRPLPANRMPKPVAFIIGWLLCAFGLIHLGMKINTWSSVMAGLTLLTYLFIYTPMKRVSTTNTVIGAVSGAFPPLIGWMAGGQPVLSAGTFYLFGLLFFWQLPHFAAINWMYREEYIRGGFKMWSNDDESGSRTARIALSYSLILTVLSIAFPFLTPHMSIGGAVGGGLLAGVMALLSWRFLKSGKREDARSLFLYTLLYLPLMMIAGYLAWRGVAV
ncbi:MAG: protoheme IX farnesyltransferase [Verrucomicrobiaceae bacterium]|nr:protoheme IX farnesyltransferase [Verrucomicrobiaceae bacterium]